MRYPTLEEVAAADRFTICKWYRFLSPPATVDEQHVMARLLARYADLGGMSVSISKELGGDTRRWETRDENG